MLYAFEGRRPSVGEGTYVAGTASVIGDVRIGRDCYIGHGAIVRADYGIIEIGDGTAVEEGVIVHAAPEERCLIGRGVTIGHGAIIHGGEIGDCAAIGMGAVVSIGAGVGQGSIVAEGAIVVRGQSVPPSVVVAGNPAKPLREVRQSERDFWKGSTEIYTALAHRYLVPGVFERLE